MPLFPNPQVSIESMQEALNQAITDLQSIPPSPKYVISWPLSSAELSGTAYEYNCVGISFSIEAEPGGYPFATPWLVDFVTNDQPAPYTPLPFGLTILPEQINSAVFGYMNFSIDNIDFIGPLVAGLSISSQTSVAGNSNVALISLYGGPVYLQSGPDTTFTAEDGSGFIFSSSNNGTGYFCSWDVKNDFPNVWIVETNTAVLLQLGMSGALTLSGIVTAPAFNSTDGSFSITGSHQQKQLNGTAITENWMTANASAVLSLDIPWEYAYSAAAPPFVQVTLGSAGTLAGYVATTAGITVSFSAAYTGAVNVYAMGAS